MKIAMQVPVNAMFMVILSILLWSATAAAQSDAAIPESTMRDPWEQQLGVLQSLSPSIASIDAGVRAELADALAGVEASVGEFEGQVDRLIDRFVADPQFAYAAARTSTVLAARLTDTHGRLDAFYTALGVRERADVRAAQASLGNLRDILNDQSRFEEDVMRALGAGSREQIIALATRWWRGEEQAIAVKKLVLELRHKLQVVPGAGVPR